MNNTKNNKVKSKQTRTAPTTKAVSKFEESDSIIEQGIVVDAHNVPLPDGSRETIYRRKSSDDRWIYGDLVVSAQGIEFVDSANQSEIPNVFESSLIEFLSANANLKTALGIDPLAIQLVSALTDVVWSDGEYFALMNFVQAGNTVAMLRDKGERFFDFYQGSRPGFVTHAVLYLVEGSGWYPIHPDKLKEYSNIIVNAAAGCKIG